MGEITRADHRLRFVISRGKVTVVDDSGPVQINQIDFGPAGSGGSLAIRDKTPRHLDFGFASNPPIGSDAVVVFVAGDRSNGIVITTGHQAYRLKNLNPGEAALHDQWGNVVKMTQAGIQITHSAEVTVTAPKIVLVSNDVELGGSGGKKVARVGDSVDLGAGTISSGSANVTAT